MSDEEKNTESEKPETKNDTKKKPTENKDNTMDIKLQTSFGTKIKITGHCSNKEIKAIGRALNHTPDQKFEVK